MQAVVAPFTQDRHDFRAAMEDRSMTDGSAGQTPCIVQGMQPEAQRRIEAAVQTRPQAPRRKLPRGQPVSADTEGAVKEGGFFLEGSCAVGPMCQADFAALSARIQLHLLLARQLLDESYGFLLHIHEPAGFFFPDTADHRLVGKLGTADTAEATVAARGSPAGLTCLQDPNREMMVPLKMQRGRKAGVAAANDGDIAGHILLQPRTGRFRDCRALLPPTGGADRGVE